jgi:hypothetical protein
VAVRHEGASGRSPRPVRAGSAPVRQSDESRSDQRILELQRAAGNRAVCQLLAQAGPVKGEVGDAEMTLQATIRRGKPSAEARSSHRVAAAPSTQELDAAEDGAHEKPVDPEAVSSAFMSQVATQGTPAGQGPGGGPAELNFPDLMMPDSLKGEDQDSLTSAISFEPTVARAGVANPFGATSWGVFNILGLVVRSTPGAFRADFRLQNPITYNVSPGGRTSIASASDPALTAANYATAASDLTPNMSYQNGKPPRTRFWAEDLTIRHEKFHSDERRRLNRAGATQAQAWLNTQAASTPEEVANLVAQVPNRVITASQAAVGTLDEKESRAYGDGAPSYKARADAISAAGASGTYT